MIIHSVEQGSDVWLQLRKKYHTASEADAMMGTSKYKSRVELMIEKKTGARQEVSDYVKGIFEEGHRLEEKARDKMENILGVELKNITATRDNLLASFDGYAIGVPWEHKTWNKHLSEYMEKGKVPDSHKWQLVHQCYVAGVNEIYFCISNDTEFDYIIYEVTENDKEELLDAWDAFEGELQYFEPTTHTSSTVEAEEAQLSEIFISTYPLTMTTSIETLKAQVREYVSEIGTDLATDDDYALAESQVKHLKKAEKFIDEQNHHVLSEFPELVRFLDEVAECKMMLSGKRLKLSKLVNGRKDDIKLQAIQQAESDIQTFMDRESVVCHYDFHSAIKGKRTTKTMLQAIDAHKAECMANACPPLSKLITEWGDKYNIPYAAMDELLNILEGEDE